MALLAAAAGYQFWLRDSSLVAIDNVDVVGVATGDRARIVSELTAAAEQMTTLHVEPERLETIAARHPTVAAIEIDANFPHGMRIEVSERPPALVAEAGDRQQAIAADGTVLTGLTLPEDSDLPAIEVEDLPESGRLGGEDLDQAVVVGAAPVELRALIEGVERSGRYGIEVTLRGGIPVRFGSAELADRKWVAAAAVLADPKLDSLTYLDVRVPARPAAGQATEAPA